MKENEGKTLKRQLSPMNVWAIAFGCIIGWGPDTDIIDTRCPILVLNHGHFQKIWSGSRGLIHHAEGSNTQ